MNNLRTFVGKYAPNHKEFGRWVDTTADINGSIIKVYRDGKWVEENQNNSACSITEEQIASMIEYSCESLKRQVDVLTEKLNQLYKEFKRLKRNSY